MLAFCGNQAPTSISHTYGVRYQANIYLFIPPLLGSTDNWGIRPGYLPNAICLTYIHLPNAICLTYIHLIELVGACITVDLISLQAHFCLGMYNNQWLTQYRQSLVQVVIPNHFNFGGSWHIRLVTGMGTYDPLNSGGL